MIRQTAITQQMSQKDSSKSFPYFCPFWRLRWVPETN